MANGKTRRNYPRETDAATDDSPDFLDTPVRAASKQMCRNLFTYKDSAVI